MKAQSTQHDREETAGFADSPSAPDLMVRLDTKLPERLPAGSGTAMYLSGACYHRTRSVRELTILVDGASRRPSAWRMPRLDLLELMQGHGSQRAYRSGFWATLALPPRAGGSFELALHARLDNGEELVVPLDRIEVVPRKGSPGAPARDDAASSGPIAICMATYNPGQRLFRAQVESLRGQTDPDWVCVISDDCSDPAHYEELEAVVGGDPRFVIFRSPDRVGPYRNFERALGLIPPEAALVALCDQDDVWYPDKLETLRRSIGSGRLAYSDQRVVDAEGNVLSETLWTGRRNNHKKIVSLLIANSVTGSAALMRREVAERALPFPEAPGWQFHDHWIALVALAMGELAYVDRPLYDYVQHGDAVLGRVVGPASPTIAPRSRWTALLQRIGAAVRGGRAAYFYGYLAREVQAQALLARMGADISPSKRRGLERYVRSARSPLAFAWLVGRSLGAVTGASSTLGTELELARGIVWRHLVGALARLPGAAARLPLEAACPPLEAESLGESRLARWRAGV